MTTFLPAGLDDDQSLLNYLRGLDPDERATLINGLGPEERTRVDTLAATQALFEEEEDEDEDDGLDELDELDEDADPSFAAKQQPHDERSEAEAEDGVDWLLDDGGVILDGTYSFSCGDDGAVYYYAGEDHKATSLLGLPGVQPGDYGSVDVSAGVPGAAQVTGNRYRDAQVVEDAGDDVPDDADEAHVDELAAAATAAGPGKAQPAPGANDPFAIYRRDTASVIRVWDATDVSKKAIKDLCAAQDSDATIPFLATSLWIFFGDQDVEIENYFEPVAITGRLRFTRNRTKPNVFSLEGIRARQLPAGFPTEKTGTGDDAALAAAERELRQLALDSDVYPYRDRNRITVTTSA